MPNQNIDLGSTEAVNFNGSEVEKLYLDGTLIWEKEDLTTAMSGSDMIGMSFTVSRNPNGSDWPPYPYHQGVSPGQRDEQGVYSHNTYTLRASGYSTFMLSHYRGSDGYQNRDYPFGVDQWNDQRWHYSQQAYGGGNSIWTGMLFTNGNYHPFGTTLKGPAGSYFGNPAGSTVVPWICPLYAGGPISWNTYLNPKPPATYGPPYDLSNHKSKFTSAKGTRLLIDSASVNIPMMEVGATITATKNNPVKTSKSGWAFAFNYPGFDDPDWDDNAWIICRIA